MTGVLELVGPLAKLASGHVFAVLAGAIVLALGAVAVLTAGGPARRRLHWLAVPLLIVGLAVLTLRLVGVATADG